MIWPLRGTCSVIAIGLLSLGAGDAYAYGFAESDAVHAPDTASPAGLVGKGAGEAAASTDPIRPDINPYDRDIQITAPLQFNQRILGELPVLLTADDRFIISTAEFLDLLAPLLAPDAQAELTALLDGRERFLPEDIAAAGIRLDYDPQLLAVLVLKIAPEKRAMEALYQNGEPEVPGDRPEDFSAYMNINASASHFSNRGGFRKPDLFLNGAVRYNNLVLEADAQGRSDFETGAYSIDRRYARLIYDQPDQARRFMVGDLDPETRGRQGFVNIGGVGVIRQRQKFNSFRNNILSGGRQLLLQEAATVRVVRNGIYQREFMLDAGQYDISNLPLDTGSNDIQLEIQNASGGRRVISYSAYLDTIDLEPGDHEYGAYFGVLGKGGFSVPDYSGGEMVFSGFLRKAFLNMPAFGIGVQATRDTQNVTGQTQFILWNGSRLRADLSFSNSQQGKGYAATLGYDQIIGTEKGYDTFSIIADFTSSDYTTVGGVRGVNPISWSLTSTYTKRLTQDVFATVNASYRISRSPLLRDSYSLTATANYRLNKFFTVQAGVDYSKAGYSSSFARRDGFGASIGLIFQPSYNQRGEARYSSARNSGSVRFQQTADNKVGALGYSMASNYDDGQIAASGQVDYVGNRFDSSISHSAFGTSFGNIGDDMVTTVRVGSSISFAGGHVAIGRTINDSFAIVYPHKTLRGKSVIVGEGLEGGAYMSRSGALGPAVQNVLTSYMNQSVRYDVIDPPRGYDVGEGVKRAMPAYKSGYAIEVGSAAFVSAMGTLVNSMGEPARLLSGVIRPIGRPDGKDEPFFTSTSGRFAIQRLEPGVEYQVQFFTGTLSGFTFRVPEDSEGLLNLGVVGGPQGGE